MTPSLNPQAHSVSFAVFKSFCYFSFQGLIKINLSLSKSILLTLRQAVTALLY